MGIVVLFRRSPTFSPFRQALLDLVAYRPDGDANDALIIGSGYYDSRVIWDQQPKCPSIHDLPIAVATGYRSMETVCLVGGAYLDEDANGDVHISNSYVCSKNGNNYVANGNPGTMDKCWSCEFDYFTDRLMNSFWLKVSGVQVRQFKVQKHWHKSGVERKWHAKIAMKLRDGRPYALLLGSSNLTNRAFNYAPHWNIGQFECDVLISPHQHAGIFKSERYELGTVLHSSEVSTQDFESLCLTLARDLRDVGLMDSEQGSGLFSAEYIAELEKLS